MLAASACWPRVVVLLAGGLGGLLQPMTGLFHESWAALLLALMIAHPSARAMVAGGHRRRSAR